MSGAVITVDIVSDIVCPWCWLGYRFFDQARQDYDGEVQLRWHPYMLDPTVPEDGQPYRDYMKKKFGDAPDSRWKAMRDMLEKKGPALGIDFRFTGIPRRPNTLRAHRVMRWAGGQGLSDKMAESLFKAFFTDHQDVGDPAVLAELAGKAGLDKALVAKLLDGDHDKDAVQAEINFFASRGITGVPAFIYGGQYLVQGAQEANTHLSILQKAASLPEMTTEHPGETP